MLVLASTHGMASDGIDVRPGQHALLQRSAPVCDRSFCPMEAGQEDAPAGVDLVRHDFAGFQF